MPLFIPKPEQQAAMWQPYLQPGEHLYAAWWFEQRLPFLVHWLIDEVPFGELVFQFLRHRYFGALTSHRLLIMGSTGWHDPIPQRFEALPRQAVRCAQFTNWIGHIAMDFQVAGEPSVRRYRVPRSQKQQAEVCLSLNQGVPTPVSG